MSSEVKGAQIYPFLCLSKNHPCFITQQTHFPKGCFEKFKTDHFEKSEAQGNFRCVKSPYNKQFFVQVKSKSYPHMGSSPCQHTHTNKVSNAIISHVVIPGRQQENQTSHRLLSNDLNPCFSYTVCNEQRTASHRKQIISV